MGTYYDSDFWHYIITVFSPESVTNYHDAHHHATIVVDAKSNKDVGISLTSFMIGTWTWEIFALDEDLALGVTYHQALYSVLRQLKEISLPFFDSYNTKLNGGVMTPTPQKRGDFPPLDLTDITLALDPSHPVTRLLAPHLGPFSCFCLYTRIPSYPKFILKVAPELEARLAKSPLAGVSAVIHLDFYRRVEGASGRGLEIVIEQGRIVAASDWMPQTPEQRMLKAREKAKAKNGVAQDGEEKVEMTAHFAPLTFTRLVTGACSIGDLMEMYEENSVGGGESRLMLETLFPKVDHSVDIFWW